jgi:hypothetical protein
MNPKTMNMEEFFDYLIVVLKDRPGKALEDFSLVQAKRNFFVLRF